MAVHIKRIPKRVNSIPPSRDTVPNATSQPTDPISDRLTPKEASDYLWAKYRIKRSVPSLASYRTRGGGPSYFKERGKKRGAITYSREGLDTWAGEIQKPRTSTSEG